MFKKIFISLLIFGFLLSIFDSNKAIASESWTLIYTMKSGRNQIQDVMSDSIHSRSKFLKIRFESELDSKFETGFFKIGCYRSFDNNCCFESIVPPTDCNYYLYDEAIIYGWELGYSDYKLNVKSDGMDWTIKVYEYDDYEKEPYFTEKGQKLILDSCSEKTESMSFSPDRGIIRVKYLAEFKGCGYSHDYSLKFTISTNPGIIYSIGCNKSYIIHIKKGATITFFVMVKGAYIKMEFFDVGHEV